MRPNYEYNFGIKDSDTPSYIKRVLSKLRVCVYALVCKEYFFQTTQNFEKNQKKNLEIFRN